MLSDLQVRQARTTGKAYALADFDGLYLHISANGFKAWHFRFTWGGKRERMSFGGYPALSLKEARDLRDEARAMLTKGVNPHSDRKRKRHAIVLAGEYTFKAIYDQWLAHRSLSLWKTKAGKAHRSRSGDVVATVTLVGPAAEIQPRLTKLSTVLVKQADAWARRSAKPREVI